MFKLDYGKGKIEVKFDGKIQYLIENEPVKTLKNPADKLLKSLKNPIGTLPLKQIIRGKKNICIVISDITRAVPTRLILETLLPELHGYGMAKNQITILIATGLHRPNIGEELIQLVGTHIAENYNIVNHDARDSGSCEHIGQTKRGTPIILDKVFTGSDFKILTGLIEPHFMAGFSGGRKAVCPGISYIDMFEHFHGPDILESSNATNAVIKGNPFHEEATEIARKAGADFIVNVTINKNKQVTGVFSGDLEEAFYAGVDFCLRSNTFKIKKESDIVITSGGGSPLDVNLYQAVKGMVGAMPAVKKGGTIIIAAECPEGIGSEEFAGLLAAEKDLNCFMGKIRSKECFTIDQWELEELAKARNKADILIYSDYLNKSSFNIPQTTLRLVDSTKDAIEIGLERHGKCASVSVIPEGPYVIPVLENNFNIDLETEK